MGDRLGLEPEPTPLEFEAVTTALAKEHPLTSEGTELVSAWRLAALQESVDRAPEAHPLGDCGLTP